MKTTSFLFALATAASLVLSGCSNQSETTEASTATTDEHAGHDHASSDAGGMNHDAAGAGSGMMAAMHANMQAMEAEKPAGNTDHDFAHLMMAHHQGAVAMADLQLKNGKDATLRQMAEKIKADQQREIAELERVATRLDGAPSNYNPNNPADPFTQKMKASMDLMMADMPRETGNTDVDFAALMIPHHQSALAMIQAELDHGRDTKLKEMAQKMMAEQKKEIEQLKAWQAKNGGATAKPTAAVYECTMGCEGSTSNKPGKCPKCGMDLVKKA
ncbi:DUF305 domain-containing protein [Hymenobacter koreensis]|uniref:DUF305 domain-containing protein n=1 Tax=Hymenobacter koreensis TaxID=1084523 RepID=A0ABP8IZ21_9BACT